MRKIIAFIFILFSASALSAPSVNEDSLTGLVSITGLDKDSPSQGCEIHSAAAEVQNVQFSDSGNSIKTIQFKFIDGKIFAMPSNFLQLNDAALSQSNQIVQQGKIYFIKFSVCGSGGFMSLIDIYKLM